MKIDDSLKEKAKRYWSMDIDELERAMGVTNVVETLPVTKTNGRVPPQGSVLLDKVSYLPKE